MAPVATLRFPPSIWSYKASALVTVVILTPLLVTFLLAQELRSFGGVATISQLVIFPAVLGAAILLYVQYRLSGSNVVAWLTLCLTLYAVQGTMLAGLRAGEPGSFFLRPGWVVIVDLPVAVLILGAVRLAPRVRLPIDPLSTGLLCGFLVAGLNVAATAWGPELTMTSPPVIVAEVLLAGVGAAIGHAAYRLDEVPRWCAVRLAIGTLALVANRLASCQDDSPAADVVALVFGVIGAVLFVTAASVGLRFAIQEQRQSLTSLADQVAVMEADERDSRARLHEITNSIASIAVASSLIQGNDDVPSSKRQKLVQMLESESARLARFLTGGAVGHVAQPDQQLNGERKPVRELVDIDEIIRPLITSQQAMQRPIDWAPSGHLAVGDPDIVAEVVSILLDNSARHAPDSRTKVEVARRGDLVEIAVRDDGPGVPPDIRSRIFEWGGRGPNSTGQGIGLHLASQLITAGGNSLRLETDRAGTSFVMGLPAASEGLS
jgi:signal transduction histidine kinase